MSAYATGNTAAGTFEPAIPHIGGILEQFVEVLAERVAERLQAAPEAEDEWLDTRGAAEHLGVHRDTIRRLAAERTLPSEQEGPGCKLFFRRSDLDAWRRAGGSTPRRLMGAAR
jgi:excisionase family DNA binding protein